MPLQLTHDSLRAILPKAPQEVINAFVAKQDLLAAAGITATRPRLAYFFANIEHECNGFAIPNLTENINYSYDRMAQVWPKRFPGGGADVRRKYGTDHGWQLKAFDDIYGNRMGNRPGTRDGSTYIGRGGPQITGRDGYRKCGAGAKLDLENHPELATRLQLQPEICVGFWVWKGMNAFADRGDFNGAVRSWNGGTNGMADRLAKLDGNDPIIARLAKVDAVKPAVTTLPGEPMPVDDVIKQNTKRERQAQAGAVVGGASAGAHEAAKTTTGTKQPDAPPPAGLVPSWVAVGVGIAAVAVLVIVAIRIAKKKRDIIKAWF